ncbi:MAG: MOSC domain-containing protein, partial [Anaerolineae bacterium]
HPKIHGGPERAICLYALEKLLALQAEGHPVFPGALGENLTLWGLPWEQVTPGVILHLGETATLQVTRYTTPCQTIAGYFRGEDILRVSQKHAPGWSRVYARVLQEGVIRIGDAVYLENL